MTKLIHRYGQMQLKNYEITEKVLGKGGFAHVRLGFKRDDNMMVAIKVIPARMADLFALEREIGIMHSLNHKNILKCYGYEKDW